MTSPSRHKESYFKSVLFVNLFNNLSQSSSTEIPKNMEKRREKGNSITLYYYRKRGGKEKWQAKCAADLGFGHILDTLWVFWGLKISTRATKKKPSQRKNTKILEVLLHFYDFSQHAKKCSFEVKGTGLLTSHNGSGMQRYTPISDESIVQTFFGQIHVCHSCTGHT